MVATDVLEDTHGFTAAGVPDPVSCVVNPTQPLSEPVIVGNGFITTVVVAVDEQLFASVTVTVYVPAAASVTLVMVGFCCVEVKLFGPVQL